jgi:alkylation response protein AidB-like acyl-CoA dehydrogenase
VAGELTAAVALDEGARHRPARVVTNARRSGAGHVLSGEKRIVAYGHVADLLIVSARTSGAKDDAAGVVLFAIPRETPGVITEPVRLLDSSMAARVRFEDAALDSDALIANVGGEALATLLAALRIGAAAELVGVGTEAASITVDYLKTRKQFGKTIGAFQALQHRAAQVHAELELARAAVFKAQHMLDRKHTGAGHAAQVAKASAGWAACLATEEGVQMHGGIGMTDEHDIGLYLKRARVLDEMYGGADFHADDLARAAGY